MGRGFCYEWSYGIDVESKIDTSQLFLFPSPFRSVISRVPVLITIPLVSRQSRWLQQFNVPVRYLYNCEISAYVSDQIVALNLNQLKVNFILLSIINNSLKRSTASSFEGRFVLMLMFTFVANNYACSLFLFSSFKNHQNNNR